MIYLLLICGIIFLWAKYCNSEINNAQSKSADYVDLDTEYCDLSSQRSYRVKSPTKTAGNNSKYHMYSEYTPVKKETASIEVIHSSYGVTRYKTGALDDDKVHEVIERYREPVKRQDSYTYRPVSFYPDDCKPVQPEEKKTAIVNKPSAPEPSSIVQYKPNELIAPIIKETREEYQLPPGAVEMPIEETAAIVATILYFIKEEPKIGITKLEAYIILLDKMCFDETGKRLFSYRLTYGPFGYYIQNFRAFLDFIESKKILSKRREYYTRRKYRIDFTAHHEVPDELFPDNMLDWMERILFVWRGAGAEHTKRVILQQFSVREIAAFTEIK